MFNLQNNKDIYFKDIYLYSIRDIDAYDLLCVESSIINDNFSLRNSKHIYGKGAKVLKHKLEYNGDCIILKLQTYNKRYDKTYTSELHMLKLRSGRWFTLFAY